MIPESKLCAVQKALLETFGVTAPDEITLLTGGLSTALVLKIAVKGQPCVLRIIMHADAFKDPARHFTCMKAAAEAGVAPAVLYANAPDGISITRFIDTTPRVDVPILPHLAQLIRTIHSLPLFPPLTRCLDGVDTFIQQFQATGILPASATAEHFALYSQIQRTYPRYDPDLVSSHNDLNPNNILFDGTRFWIVDWEAAFASDRYVDLANVANSFASTEEAEEELLKGYFGDTLNDDHRARLFLMRQVSHMCFGAVFMNLAAAVKPPGTTANADMNVPSLREFYHLFRTGKLDPRTAFSSFEGRLLYAKVLLNESLGMMKTPRFAESISRMRP